MKKLVLFCALLGGGAFAQELIPQPIPCIVLNQPELDLVYPSGYIPATECIQTTGNLTFDAQTNYSIKAGESITFKNSTHISLDNSHTFHAFIQKPGFDLAWYGPSTSWSVGQYEKLELGLQFEDSINDLIMDYVNHDPFANQPIGSLNPYNPEQVDVYAEFWIKDGANWVGPKRINGFYYEEYLRGQNDWTELESEHNFRFRYTPRELGNYRCKITTILNETQTLESDFFYFGCVPSGSSDFMKVGQNKRYFTIDDETFFPVGQNLTGPNTPYLSREWATTPCLPEHYVDFLNLLTELSESGANYFRYIQSPWQTEIEFEHLNNYSTRMSNAWEFDQILDTIKTLDLRMHFNMQMHYAFEAPSGYAMTFWDWSAKGDSLNNNPDLCFQPNDSGYCYRKELALLNPVDFLTDNEAIKNYKRRLRYMIARWGFSPDIGIMELLSEAPHVGEQWLIKAIPVNGYYGCIGIPDTVGWTTRPRFDYPYEFYPLLDNWQKEMLEYIKVDLGHEEHLLGVSSSGAPEFEKGDVTFNSDLVDVASFNYYQLTLERPWFDYRTLNNKDTNVAGGYHVQTMIDQTVNPRFIDKPVIHSEYGAGAGLFRCDNDLDYIKPVFTTPFLGQGMMAMPWNYHRNLNGVWDYLGIMNNFMSGVKLDEENWRVGTPVRPDYSNQVFTDEPVEMYYLISEQASTNAPRKAVGVLTNRTFNYYTQSVDSCDISAPFENIYKTEQDFLFSDITELELIIDDMGSLKTYDIYWYNALTGNLVINSIETTGLNGELQMNFPESLTGNSDLPIMLFQVVPQGANLKLAESSNQPLDLTQNINVPETLHEITIYPNPANNVLNINIPNTYVGSSWAILDGMGRIIKKGVLKSNQERIKTVDIERGSYYLKIYSETYNKTYPLILN